jgi:Tfp pilus assembly protein PilO
MAALTKSINLLTGEIKPQSQWDRIYAWTANTAKYVIILTEMLVLGAIGYRFILDGRISSINEDIATQKSLLDAHKADEEEMRMLLINLDSIKLMEESHYSLSSYYAQIMQLIPSEVEVKTISIDINSSSLTGQVTNYDTLLQLENNLKSATAVISNVTMAANQSTGTGISFSASFKIKLQ